jgi:hypothetical protein
VWQSKQASRGLAGAVAASLVLFGGVLVLLPIALLKRI